MAFIEHMFVAPERMLVEGTLAYCLNQCKVETGTGLCNSHCGSLCLKTTNMESEGTCWERTEEGGKLAEGPYGFIQLLGLMAGYGYMLMNAATLIGDGAELLLLVPSMATLVGTLVLPVLGAVPDGAIVFFSGLGEGAQEKLAVGMGALAGSTIMLLTIPWFLSIYAGRVDIIAGLPRYKPPRGEKKLSPGRSASECGIAADTAVRSSCTLMLVTCVPYFIIQGPAFFPKNGLSVTDLHPNNTHNCATPEECDILMSHGAPRLMRATVADAADQRLVGTKFPATGSASGLA